MCASNDDSYSRASFAGRCRGSLVHRMPIRPAAPIGRRRRGFRSRANAAARGTGRGIPLLNTRRAAGADARRDVVRVGTSSAEDGRSSPPPNLEESPPWTTLVAQQFQFAWANLNIRRINLSALNQCPHHHQSKKFPPAQPSGPSHNETRHRHHQAVQTRRS